MCSKRHKGLQPVSNSLLLTVLVLCCLNWAVDKNFMQTYGLRCNVHVFLFSGLRLLGRKYTSKTNRLYASRKVWGHAIPTRNCDIIMTLPATTDDMILMWLLARLRTRTPEIHVYVRHWKNTNVYAFYMTATYQQ